jgi:hypothetical protein
VTSHIEGDVIWFRRVLNLIILALATLMSYLLPIVCYGCGIVKAVSKRPIGYRLSAVAAGSSTVPNGGFNIPRRNGQ